MVTTFLGREAVRVLFWLGVALLAIYFLSLGAWLIPGVPEALGGRVAVALVGIGHFSAIAGLASLAGAGAIAGLAYWRRRVRSRPSNVA